MQEIASANINSFGLEPGDESVFILTASQLQVIITKAL